MAESSNTNDDNNFKLDQDQIDALRMEAQSISPDEQAEFKKTIRESHRMLLNKMGMYIPHPMDDGEMANKFIMTDAENFEVFHNHWVDTSGASVHMYTSNDPAARAFVNEGNHVVTFPDDPWKDLPNKSEFVTGGRSEKDAKSLVNNAIRTNMILHEMTHLYQDTKNGEPPLWFCEAQAYWVGREAAPEDTQVHTDFFDQAANFYQLLLDKYGKDEIHRAGFNKVKNGYILSRLKKEFTPEIRKRIFPNYLAPTVEEPKKRFVDKATESGLRMQYGKDYKEILGGLYEFESDQKPRTKK